MKARLSHGNPAREPVRAENRPPEVSPEVRLANRIQGARAAIRYLREQMDNGTNVHVALGEVNRIIDKAEGLGPIPDHLPESGWDTLDSRLRGNPSRLRF